MTLYSPFTPLRPSQELLANFISENMTNRKHCLCHAPTGIGKTAAVLAALLPIAEKENCKIIYLTSRHTQHAIVRETVQRIRKVHLPFLSCVSLIRKQQLCSQEGAEVMNSGDFHPYCKHMKENNSCSYFTSFKNRTPQHMILVEDLLKESAPTPDIILAQATAKGSCPYETTIELAQKAMVIIGDYSYIFHPTIRESFLKRIGVPLERLLIVVDEGHNLPSRVRAMMSTLVTTFTLRRALQECKEWNAELTETLSDVQDAINEFTQSIPAGEERTLSPNAFAGAISDLQEFSDELGAVADKVREEKKVSSTGVLSKFFSEWEDHDPEQYVRTIRHTTTNAGPSTVVNLTCLNPASVTGDVLASARGVVVMSGTLTPTEMYRDVLGFSQDTPLKEFESPFPVKNRKFLIVPKTTTKYDKRSSEQFAAIASLCSSMMSKIPGNVALYFPSYQIQEQVHRALSNTPLSGKELVKEFQGMTTEEKTKLVEKLKASKNSILLGVAAGSFGEGVDLPGVFSGVIVVGVPLERPSIETNALIEQYNRKYGKGWEYGYVLPALTKAFQNVGRCIRTETDRGVLIFLDERYLSGQYRQCFPKEWNITTTITPEKEIETFFKSQQDLTSL